MTNNIPTVVVLMATYNGEKFIREQIDSVLQQKGVNIVLFVSDDGSTDKTKSILDEYQNKKMLTWTNGPKKGAAENFLTLMRQAPAGDYYAFCDQDDVWDEIKIKEAIKHLTVFDNDEPALYYSGLKVVDKDLNLITVHSVNLKRSELAKFIFAGIAGCTMVFNNALLKACNRKCPQYTRMHDIWVFNVCVALGGSYYADSNSFINYRQHDNNVVGIRKNSLVDSYRKVVIDSRVSEHIGSLVDCYSNEIKSPYKELCNDIIQANVDRKSRKKLLSNKDINFNNKGLNILFKIKVFLRKM